MERESGAAHPHPHGDLPQRERSFSCPAYLVILIMRGIFGFSYEGALLYMSLLLHDHLVPLLAGLGGFLLLQRKLNISRDDETIFLTVFSFLSGFFAILNLTDAFFASGSWDPYALFLLPSLRLATILFVSLLAQRFFRWEGTDGVLFCGAAAGLAILINFAGFSAGSTAPAGPPCLRSFP